MNQTDTGRNQIHVRIVYWGPAGAGKTTCLAALGPRLDPEEGFPLYSLAATDGSTYHFDLLPLDYTCDASRRKHWRDASATQRR